MTIRDIFVPLFQQLDFAPQLDAAASLAPRLGASINVVFTRPDPTLAAASVLGTAGAVFQAVEREVETAQKSAQAQFEKWRDTNGLSGNVGQDDVSAAVATWHERMGPVTDTMVEIGRVSDLVVIGRPDPYEVITDEVFTAAIYATGQPALIVPVKIQGDLLAHVMIAWNGSLQAARAVSAAMPLLGLAEHVSVFTVPSQPDSLHCDLGLIEHLSRHGINAKGLAIGEGRGDVGGLLLDTAEQENATMVVMGAYTHSRVREAFLGGVTHKVLKNAQIPVVMMH